MGCPQTRPTKHQPTQHQQSLFSKENVDEHDEITVSVFNQNQKTITKVSNRKATNSFYSENIQNQATKNHSANKHDSIINTHISDFMNNQNIVLQKANKFQNDQLMDPQQKKQMYNRVRLQKSKMQTYEVLSQFESIDNSVQQFSANTKVNQINWGNYIDDLQCTIHKNNQILMKNTQMDHYPQFKSVIQPFGSSTQSKDNKLIDQKTNGLSGQNHEQILVNNSFNSMGEIKFQLFNNLNSMNNVQQFQSKQDR